MGVARWAYLGTVIGMTGQAHATERERSRLEPRAARGGHGAIGGQLAAVRVVITHGSQVPGHPSHSVGVSRNVRHVRGVVRWFPAFGGCPEPVIDATFSVRCENWVVRSDSACRGHADR